MRYSIWLSSMLLIPPRPHHLPEDSKFADMVRIVISNKEDLAENGLAVPMWDRRVQVHSGVSNHFAQRLEVCAEGRERLLPGDFVSL